VLKAFNWTIVSVPYYDWYGMDNTSVKASVSVLCIHSDAVRRNRTAMKRLGRPRAYDVSSHISIECV